MPSAGGGEPRMDEDEAMMRAGDERKDASEKSEKTGKKKKKKKVFSSTL